MALNGPSYAANKKTATKTATADVAVSTDEYPIEKGGGWWECSDGFKVQDEYEAQQHEASL